MSGGANFDRKSSVAHFVSVFFVFVFVFVLVLSLSLSLSLSFVFVCIVDSRVRVQTLIGKVLRLTFSLSSN